MTQQRIDIEAYTQMFEADDGITEEQLVAFGLSAISELKRCYEIIDGFDETVELLEVAEDVLGRSGWYDIYCEEIGGTE